MKWPRAVLRILPLDATVGDLIEYGKSVWNRFARKVRLPAVPLGKKPRIPAGCEVVRLSVSPATQADFFSCGAVAGWTALKAIYPDAGGAARRKLYDLCDPDVDHGTPTNRLVRALRASGVRVSLRRGKAGFRVLKRALDSGHPVIVCLDVPGTGFAHWSTVYGYCERQSKRGSGQWLLLHNNSRPFGAREDGSVIPYMRFQSLQIEEWLVCSGKRRLSDEGTLRR